MNLQLRLPVNIVVCARVELHMYGTFMLCEECNIESSKKSDLALIEEHSFNIFSLSFIKLHMTLLQHFKDI